jgi:bacterioferritin-associated ferredoxin
MILCSCKNINENAIKILVDAGLRYQAIVDVTGMTKTCGACRSSLVTTIINCDKEMNNKNMIIIHDDIMS